MFSALVCTLFVSVDDKLVSILPYHCKLRRLQGFLLRIVPLQKKGLGRRMALPVSLRLFYIIILVVRLLIP